MTPLSGLQPFKLRKTELVQLINLKVVAPVELYAVRPRAACP